MHKLLHAHLPHVGWERPSTPISANREHTLQSLQTAFEERLGSRSVLSMKINPVYDFIRDDPRFIALLAKVGLSE